MKTYNDLIKSFWWKLKNNKKYSDTTSINERVDSFMKYDEILRGVRKKFMISINIYNLNIIKHKTEYFEGIIIWNLLMNLVITLYNSSLKDIFHFNLNLINNCLLFLSKLNVRSLIYNYLHPSYYNLNIFPSKSRPMVYFH